MSRFSIVVPCADESTTRMVSSVTTPPALRMTCLNGEEALTDLRELDFEVVALDRGQAEGAGLLRATTREAGLSLGDRACLALARQRGMPALTTDRRQAEAGSAAGITIELLR